MLCGGWLCCIFIFMRICTKRSCPVGHIYWIIFTILGSGQCVCESTQRYLSLLHACYCIYGFHALCHDNHFGSGRLRLPQPVCSRRIPKLHSDAAMIRTSSRLQPFVFAAFIEPCVMGRVCAHVLWKLDKGGGIIQQQWHARSPSPYRYLPADTAGKYKAIVFSEY